MLKSPEMGPFYARGLHFSCVKCSACCRFEEGFVFLSEKDAFKLSAFLNIEYYSFIKTYCRWIPAINSESFGAPVGVLGGNTSGNPNKGQNKKFELSLKEKYNKDCIFWAAEPNEGCTVYEVRPLQCRAYPFWSSVLRDKSNWEMNASHCPGMDKGLFHSKKVIKKWLATRQNEPIISRNSNSEGDF